MIGIILDYHTRLYFGPPVQEVSWWRLPFSVHQNITKINFNLQIGSTTSWYRYGFVLSFGFFYEQFKTNYHIHLASARTQFLVFKQFWSRFNYARQYDILYLKNVRWLYIVRKVSRKYVAHLIRICPVSDVKIVLVVIWSIR